jgi:hypothetical protein
MRTLTIGVLTVVLTLGPLVADALARSSWTGGAS